MQPVVVLSIAGSDSGGGAGIQADLHSFASAKTFGTTALTAITAQNTVGVTDVHALQPALVVAQIDAVMSDFSVSAVKTGMLATAEIVQVVAQRLSRESVPLVVDPVVISTTGALLLGPGGVEAYRSALLPLATVITPNRDELAALLEVDRQEISSTASLCSHAEQLARDTGSVVVAKGGHLDPRDGLVTDVLVAHGQTKLLPHTHVSTPNNHGTGCSFAASITAHLGRGFPLDVAIERAQAFVHSALEGASTWRLGNGHGPLDHHGLNRSLAEGVD
jgi:hydroxymethylpyrimidine/phosphomethylpyrimidine kinase